MQVLDLPVQDLQEVLQLHLQVALSVFTLLDVRLQRTYFVLQVLIVSLCCLKQKGEGCGEHSDGSRPLRPATADGAFSRGAAPAEVLVPQRATTGGRTEGTSSFPVCSLAEMPTGRVYDQHLA